jgi:protein-tyrosine phosphatase
MTTNQKLTGSDMVTLMAACAIATERFPDASEYEAMRQRILKAADVTIETPDREFAEWRP